MGLLDRKVSPCAGDVFRMPPRLYDPSDADIHPVLVLEYDPMTKWARVVTRTSDIRHATNRFVRDPADLLLFRNARGWFNVVGYWRLGDPKSIPLENFYDPEALNIGRLGQQSWERALREWRAGP